MCINSPRKLLTFINRETEQKTVIEGSLQPRRSQLSLREIISEFNKRKPSGRRRYFGIAEQDQDSIFPLNQPYLVDKNIFNVEKVIVYHSEESSSGDTQSEQRPKRQRNRQRTILEVILNVKKWRALHMGRKQGCKVSLVDAANSVGISKKSLDDYFCQLRLGQKYGFDFKANLDNKIGELRAFVKAHRTISNQHETKQKLPKTLKIIEEFDLPREQQQLENLAKVSPSHEQSPQPEVPILTSMLSEVDESQDYQEHNRIVEEACQGNLQNLGLTPMDRINQEEFENQFFQNFELIVNQPYDPFVKHRPKQFRTYERKSYVQDIEPSTERPYYLELSFDDSL